MLDILSDDNDSFIDWPCYEDRRAMQRLVCGFTNFLGFVDGTKETIFRPGDADIQSDTYEWYH